MRKIAIVTISFLLLFFLQIQTSNANTTIDIDQLVRMITTNDAHVTIESWDILIKEEHALSSQQLYQKQQNQNATFKWQEQDDFFLGTGKIDGVAVVIKIVALPHDQSLLIYHLNGTKWCEKTKQITDQLVKQQKFNKNIKIYSCLKGISDDNMNKDLLFTANQWLKKFEANVIDQLDEGDFLVISGQSPLLTGQLSNQMNLQLAFRYDEEKNQIAYTIGTPIIMSEY